MWFRRVPGVRVLASLSNAKFSTLAFGSPDVIKTDSRACEYQVVHIEKDAHVHLSTPGAGLHYGGHTKYAYS